MRLLTVISIILFVFTRCSWDVETTIVNSNAVLSDGNSKVWMVNHLIKDGLDFQQPDYLERDLIVFYSTGTCRILKWKDFGEKKGDFFKYELIFNGENNPKIKLIRKSKIWEFELSTYSNDKLVFIPINGTSFKYKMTIIPLPEW